MLLCCGRQGWCTHSHKLHLLALSHLSQRSETEPEALHCGLVLRSMKATGPMGDDALCLHSHSHWQAFRGLCRKNLLTQKKRWRSLSMHLLLPVLLLISAALLRICASLKCPANVIACCHLPSTSDFESVVC
jgi:hypothetical protein